MIESMDSRKIDILFVVLIIVLLGGAYLAIFHRGVTRYFYLKTQEKVLLESLKSASAVNHTLKGYQEQISVITKKLNEFNERLPREKNIDEILKQVTQVAVRTGVELRTIEPQDIVEGGIYNKFPIKIRLKSTFKDCFRFFVKLERLPRILQLEKLSMKSKQKTNELETEVLLSAFMLK